MRTRWKSTTGPTFKLSTCSGTRSDASNYKKQLGFTYNATNEYYLADVGHGYTARFWNQTARIDSLGLDTAFNFKPFSDNNRDIGASALRVRDFILAAT